MKEDIDNFRHAIKLMASLQLSIEMTTDARSRPYVKKALKNKLRLAEDQLERDIEPFVNKLYETDEDVFQNIQNAIENLIDYVITKTIEETVNRSIEVTNQKQHD